MKKIANIVGLFLALFVVTSCENDYGVFNSDNIAEVPVTYGCRLQETNPFVLNCLSLSRVDVPSEK
jgi:hypothetical protein